MTNHQARLGPDTFADFARARTPHLFHLAWLLCGHHAEAEDLVQETLTKVYVRVSKRFSAPLDHPAAYAQTVLTHTFISARRRRSSMEVPYDDLPEDGVDDHAATSDIKIALNDALAGLKPLDRAVVVLRFLDDLSVDRVAQMLDLTPGAVRSRSTRAMSRLREGVIR